MMALRFASPVIIAGLLSFSLTGFSGCGPAAPDYSLGLKSRADLSLSPNSQSVTQHTSSSIKHPLAPAVGSPSELSTTPTQTPVETPHQPEHLAVPAWFAQALEAPEISVRIQALDTWAQQGSQAPLDPLVVALDNENDDVRIKAMEIIERHWAMELETVVQSTK